jgi:hypothetical protein
MEKRRQWMCAMLEDGLKLGVLEAIDLLRHMTPSVLATDLPPAMVASLLQAGLSGAGFNPDVVVTTLGVPALAEHVPLPVLWSCLQDAADVIIREHPLTHGLQTRFGEALGDEPEIEVVES